MGDSLMADRIFTADKELRRSPSRSQHAPPRLPALGEQREDEPGQANKETAVMEAIVADYKQAGRRGEVAVRDFSTSSPILAGAHELLLASAVASPQY